MNRDPWHPMSNPIDLKYLGKLNEELAEAISASSRCMIQGIDERHPVTNELNSSWLMQELADVMANIFLVVERFGFDMPAMEKRAAMKSEILRAWHKGA